MNEILCRSNVKLIVTSAPAAHLILSFNVVSFDEAEPNEWTNGCVAVCFPLCS